MYTDKNMLVKLHRDDYLFLMIKNGKSAKLRKNRKGRNEDYMSDHHVIHSYI